MQEKKNSVANPDSYLVLFTIKYLDPIHFSINIRIVRLTKYLYQSENTYIIISVNGVSRAQPNHGFNIRWLLISRCARMMKSRSFSEKNTGFDDSLDVTYCLQQIEMPDLLQMCAPCSELPSIIYQYQDRKEKGIDSESRTLKFHQSGGNLKNLSSM